MSASSSRVAVAAVVVVVLGLAGAMGWRRMSPSERPAAQPASSQSAGAKPASPSSASTGSSSVASRDEAPEPPSAPNPVEAPKADAPPPSFDVVRVEPTGDALLAGRGKPNNTVTLVDRGKVVAEAKTDAAGNFVLMPPPLQPGDYALSLREGQGTSARDSKQSVVVSVPSSKTQQVVVALSEPGRPTQLLSAPPDPADAPPAPKPAAATPPPTMPQPPTAATSPPKLAIRSVELENGSGLFASGVAPPGTDVRLYLNDSRVADVIAAAAGAWSVTVRKGLSAGRYAVRADSLKNDRTVTARVEVPFDVPAPMSDDSSSRAATASPPSPAIASTRSEGTPAEPSAADAGTDVERSVAETPPTRVRGVTPADAVVDELKTELVSHGDNLWRISRKRLGFGTRYTQIYAANAAQIRDPKLIYPGQVFVLPRE